MVPREDLGIEPTTHFVRSWTKTPPSTTTLEHGIMAEHHNHFCRTKAALQSIGLYNNEPMTMTERVTTLTQTRTLRLDQALNLQSWCFYDHPAIIFRKLQLS